MTTRDRFPLLHHKQGLDLPDIFCSHASDEGRDPGLNSQAGNREGIDFDFMWKDGALVRRVGHDPNVSRHPVRLLHIPLEGELREP